MIRTLGVLLVAGLFLSACGSVSGSSAMTSWVVQSSYEANARTMNHDAQRAALVLRSGSTSDAGLRTVCGVMDFDAESLNASLPTPDHQATNLLSRALSTLGAAANECYDTSAPATTRALALSTLSRGVSQLAEASARIQIASSP